MIEYLHILNAFLACHMLHGQCMMIFMIDTI